MTQEEQEQTAQEEQEQSSQELIDATKKLKKTTDKTEEKSPDSEENTEEIEEVKEPVNNSEYKCFTCSKIINEDYIKKKVRCPYCGSKIIFKARTKPNTVNAR
ncbi:MAG: hypothetical protein U9R00_01590 [Patescibacteria group bacterium]|nr:hypothetical protein [Patescibacteria group bacterium]